MRYFYLSCKKLIIKMKYNIKLILILDNEKYSKTNYKYKI
jgi:hypothetical protein